jgi:glucokinase
MSALNESLVLDFVRERGDTSRSEIAHSLGLSLASVSRIVARLIRAELITESSRPADGRGRPAASLCFDTRAGCVLAIDLGGTQCHGVLADLAGQVLVEDVRATASESTPYATLLSSIGHLQAAATTPLVAAAIGVPAIVDPARGQVLGGPNVLWHDFALLEALRPILDVPLHVDNDVKLAAMAQAWRGLGRGLPDFATISIGTGVGAAIVANGELVRGQNNAAGELGYLLIDRRQLGDAHAGGLGGLERVISGPAIAARAREILAAASGRRGTPSRLDPERVSSEDVLVAAREGDPVAEQVMGEFLDGLVVALIALATTSDATLIIIDGGVGRQLQPYLGWLTEALARHTPWTPRLAISQLGPSATVTGAIATALWLDRQRAMRPATQAPTRAPTRAARATGHAA